MASRWLREIRKSVTPYWRTVAGSGSLHLMSANLFNQSLGFISSLFVVRFLKPDELAEARVIGTYGGYVVLLGSLGLATSVLTYLPRSDSAECRRCWLKLTLAATGTVTFLLSMIAALLSSHGWLMSEAHTAYWYRWSLLGGLATSASGILIAFYQAERAVRQLAGIQSAMRVVALVVIVGGAWLGGFAGYIVAGILSSYLLLAGLVIARRQNYGPVSRVRLPAGYLKVAALALCGTLLWTVGRSADVVVLDRVVADRTQFGCYALAITVTSVLSIMIPTVQVVAIPFFAARHRDHDWVRRNAAKWQIAGSLAAVITAILLFGVGFLLIQHVYGAAYIPAVAFLVPLLLAQCLLGTFHIQAAALIGMGLVKVNTAVAAIVVPLSVLTTVFLAQHYGVWGAAWAQVVTAGGYAVVQALWGWMALSRQPRAAAPEAQSEPALRPG